MNMKQLILLFILFSTNVSIGQKITVIDMETTLPISNVLVTNQDNSIKVTTDDQGIVDISSFALRDVLFFQHVGYSNYKILKRLIRGKKVIELQNKTRELEEVFLSASKGKELRKRIAEQVAVFSIKDIQRTAPQTAADMLAEIPGIKVQRSQFGGGSPVLRGMEANRVLLVVDGVRMNNAIYRKGHLQNSITVSPNLLDRTEVIFGPSSVIYGSDALGGVIHYYTRKPKTSEVNTINSSFLSRYSSVNDEKTVQGGVELQFKKWASFTSVSYSSFGDLRMGSKRSHGFNDWGLITEYSNNTDHFFSEDPIVNSNPTIQRNTGYNQTDILQKFFIPLSAKTELSFNIQYGTSTNIPRFDRLTERRDGELRFAEWYYGPQERFLISSQLEIKPERRWLDNGMITLAYQNIEESRINRKFGSLDRTIREENVDVFSLNGDFSVPLTTSKDRILSYGFEVSHNDVGSTPTGETITVEGNRVTGISGNFPVQSRYADGGSTYTNGALYLNYRQDINSKSTLNTGIRFTDTFLNAKWIDETFITLPDNEIYVENSAFTATIGYVYKPTNSWQLNGVLSSGFRSPNIDDVGKIREKAGDVTVPNIDLQPEFAYNAEVGVLKYSRNRKFHVGLTTYYTLLDNYIVREDFMLDGSSTIIFDGEEGNIVANVNRDQAYIVGCTFTAQGSISNTLNARGSFTYTKGKAYDTKESLSSIPPLFGAVQLSYEKPNFESSLGLRFNGRKKITDYNFSEGIDNVQQTPIIDPNATEEVDIYYGNPSWVTLNFNTKYRLTKNIDLRVSVDNILDQHYKEFASAISAPGRNFSFSVLANF